MVPPAIELVVVARLRFVELELLAAAVLQLPVDPVPAVADRLEHLAVPASVVELAVREHPYALLVKAFWVSLPYRARHRLEPAELALGSEA